MLRNKPRDKVNYPLRAITVFLSIQRYRTRTTIRSIKEKLNTMCRLLRIPNQSEIKVHDFPKLKKLLHVFC